MNKLVVLILALATAGNVYAGGKLSAPAQKERNASKAAEGRCRDAVMAGAKKSAPDSKGAATLMNKTFQKMAGLCGGTPLFQGCKIIASGSKCSLQKVDANDDRTPQGSPKYFPKDFS